jgi:hypothetical protein
MCGTPKPGTSAEKIRLIVNYEHIANVLRVRRELCVGERVWRGREAG